MSRTSTARKVSLVLLAGFALSAGVTASVAEVVTVSFQNGVNGYQGTTQFRITGDGGSIIDADFVQIQGGPNATANQKRWAFWTFSDIVGTSPGQIPPGATIISARLELRTCSFQHTAAKSTGPVCVARMLVPMEYIPNVPTWRADATTWFTFSDDGPNFQDRHFDRPVGGYIDMMEWDRVESAEIGPIVQAWADGEPNNGAIVIGDTTDTWVVEGFGQDAHHPGDVTRRPRLVVDYLPRRGMAVVFQQGVNGYDGCSMLRLGQDSTVVGNAVDVEGTAAYLKAGTGPDDPQVDALIRFDQLFGSGTNRIPANTPILKAYLTLTTPGSANSTNVRSMGPFSAHQLLVDVSWDGSGQPVKPFLWSQFAGDDGPSQADNEIGPALSSAQAMFYDSRAHFDVTSAVQAWQAGSPNYGLAIKPGTSDGWKIFWTSVSSPSDVRPQLVIVIPRVPSKPADFNGDTYVDLDDFAIFADCASGDQVPFSGDCAKADLDDDGDVDMTDFAVFQICYSPGQMASLTCRQ